MKVEKIIFLDWDGVIITPRTKFLKFDPICMCLLKELINKTNAFIIITSSWRIGNTFRALRAMFDGFGLFDQVIGMTPRLNDQSKRGKEIDEWLTNPIFASNKFELDIKSFVILDDESDMKPHMDKLVQTKMEIGLAKGDVEKAKNILDNM